MKPCLHQILIPQPRPVCPCLVLAPISEKFLDTKMMTDFRLSHYIELNRTSAKTRLFEVVKQNLGVNTNETLLFSPSRGQQGKNGFRFYFKFWQTRRRLLKCLPKAIYYN